MLKFLHSGIKENGEKLQNMATDGPRLSLDLPAFREGVLMVCLDGCPADRLDPDNYIACVTDSSLEAEYDIICAMHENDALSEGVWPVIELQP